MQTKSENAIIFAYIHLSNFVKIFTTCPRGSDMLKISGFGFGQGVNLKVK